MIARSLFRIAVAAAVLGLGAPSRAQQPPSSEQRAAPPSADLSAQVDELNRTLREIADMLREHLQGQQVDHLMKRIDMQKRSLAPLEQELRDARSERHGIAENVRELEAHLEFLEEQMRTGAEQSISFDDSSYATEKKRLSVQLELLRERMEAADGRVYELEGRLQTRHDEILAWEEMVDEALGLR